MDSGIPLDPRPHLAPLSLPGAATDAVAPPADDAQYRAQVKAAAQKFESFFISQMLKDMRSATRTLAGEGSLTKDPVNDDMQSYADSAVADQMAGQHAFGIADVILRQLLPESTPAASPTLAPLNTGPAPVAVQKS
jgi:flagellar protein FlgJ